MQYGFQNYSPHCQIDTPVPQGKRLTILIAGTSEGFVDNASLISEKNIKDSSANYHEDMNASSLKIDFQTN